VSDGDGVGWVIGVAPSGPVEANKGVRARVRAAGKALEGVTDTQTDDRRLLHYSVSQKIPLRFSDFFPKLLGVFRPNFTCLLLVLIYGRVRIFIQLSAILRKLCHIKCDHHQCAFRPTVDILSTL